MSLLVIVVVSLTASRVSADDEHGTQKPDLSTPEATFRTYKAAITARDWVAAEACLSSHLLEVLKDAIKDRSFFDQYVVSGFASKTLELIPVRHTTERDIAALPPNRRSKPAPPVAPGSIDNPQKRFTAQVGQGGGPAPWLAMCTFVWEEHGWTLTADKLKTKEDFDRTVAVHPTMSEEIVLMKTPVRTA